MSKPTSSSSIVRLKPFYSDDKITLTTLHSKSMITGFRCVVNDKQKDFLAKGKQEGAITEAFMQMEKYLGTKIAAVK